MLKIVEIKEEILKTLKSLTNTPSGFPHARVARKLNRLCLDNPQVVASIAFDSSISEEKRTVILFTWSKDHNGSCAEEVNRRWYKMMRTLIVPDMNRLTHLARSSVVWYRRRHGL